MQTLEFLSGLLDDDTPRIAAEDLDGEHGSALRIWQSMGFLREEPSMNPTPGCPHCGEGVPYRLGERFICNACRSTIDHRHLLLWPIARDRFLEWLAAQWRLRGEVRRIDDRLWQLGTWVEKDGQIECFFCRSGRLSDLGRTRLAAYRATLLLYGLTPPQEGAPPAGHRLSLLEALRIDDSLHASELPGLLRTRGNVRFDAHSGALWVGDARLGEIPVGSKEYFFLDRLAGDLDRFVPYGDLKLFVLRQSGSIDATEEATFCQGLKSRIKKKWVPKIDLLLATTNKADGYRLRSYAEL